MEKIAIIGGGIIGMTLASYLDTSKFNVALFDEGTGQATKASAGIISPWLSKRRNKQWYRLAKDGAAFFPKLIKDFQLDQTIYAQSGTLLLRPEKDLAQALPLLKPAVSLRISGGGRLDGKAYLEHLGQRLVQKQIEQIQAKVTLHKKNDSWLIKGPFGEYTADRVILTPGPALKPLLKNLGYSADIRPQKGQLLAFQTSYKMSQDWPVAMLDGEADFIPFMDGKILLGATHENDQGWDLAPTSEAYKGLTKSTEQFLTDPDQIKNWPYEFRVGTRAYTSDFSPFFGVLPDDPSLLAASGLGSSGLTTGPYIGYLLANFLNTGHWSTEDYQKDISTYITKNPS